MSNIDYVNHPPHYKYCGKCKEEKPVKFFAKNSCKKDGLQERCTPCRLLHHQKNKEEINRKRKASYDAEKKWEEKIKYSYGINKAKFLSLLEEQGYRCAICNTKDWGRGKKTNRPHIDHCHSTGKVRGLLCNTCNRALGMLQDSIDILRNSILYLEKHNEARSC